MKHMLRKASGPILALCALLVACGGTPSPSQPTGGTPVPTPTPAPTPASAGLLHVLQQPYVMTYKIDAATGRLHPRAAQNTGDTQMLASDPRGRYVYSAYYSARTGSYNGLSGVVAYAPNQSVGFLEPVSEITGHGGEWVSFSAGLTRLHGVIRLRGGTAGRRIYYCYESVAVGGDGQLGDVTLWWFQQEDHSGLFHIDVRSDMLHKGGRFYGWGGLGGLAAHAIEPDGQLRQTGWTDLCVATTMEPFYGENDPDAPFPLVAARGFLFAAASLPGRRTVCSYQGQRLKPLADLGFSASVAEAFVPDSESQPVRLAMGVEAPAGKTTRHELRLFSMNGEGDLQLLDSEDLPRSVRQILFHPSGRFLYVSDTDETLFAYALGPEGRLELIESIDQVGESLAVTLPAAGS